ncbi:pyridine nucleotide-disulphide oxidoreductase dimerisation region [Desulfatibacillum aliphaticivorans]|uniref:Pyridine nucleotide-disulphide oxidoreductase dimerisation region n=1 Tax=Desulfatibacillum aliphaticivorans TaxID=218208 RepID=B8FL56_DESAL|nr:FAD-dependent oxidoreductase [Desulfatibacillum aliphaticivorans]ACL04691.1 pyridine nucleotide-disulphide oxidoreductase dimerisation region [Desulfatibacillum aliphaticivorans]
MADYDIGIIGGGAGGLTAASGAAQLGAKTLLVEKEPLLGGDCLHFGCVPSKTLIKSAKVYHYMKIAQDFGLPAVDLPPVDFSQIAARIAGVIQTIQRHDSEERFCSLGAKVLFGEPFFSDEHTIDLDGKKITADHWVIATGSSAMIPPIPGLDQCPHLTNRDIFSLQELPESMIVLGGGPIGIEMSQAFARLGCQVTVVERNTQILGPEDADMAAIVREVLEKEGVAFRLGCTAQEVKDLGSGRQLVIQTEGGRSETIEAKEILVALGRKANVEGLNLDALAIKHSPRGMPVDKRCRTKHKHIYAVGDCNGGLQFTHVAGYEGGIALSNAILHLPRKADYTWVPWCTYTDPEIGSIGMNEKRARAAGIEPKVIIEEFSGNDRALAEGQSKGCFKLVLDEKEKPIGVQVVGPEAGNIINQWVGIMNGKVKLSTVAGAIHPYPTLAEISKRAAGNVFAPKLYSEKVKKTLKFFFNLKGRACSLDSLDE